MIFLECSHQRIRFDYFDGRASFAVLQQPPAHPSSHPSAAKQHMLAVLLAASAFAPAPMRQTGAGAPARPMLPPRPSMMPRSHTTLLAAGTYGLSERQCQRLDNMLTKEEPLIESTGKTPPPMSVVLDVASPSSLEADPPVLRSCAGQTVLREDR